LEGMKVRIDVVKEVTDGKEPKELKANAKSSGIYTGGPSTGKDKETVKRV
jgi:hypothetical protein